MKTALVAITTAMIALSGPAFASPQVSTSAMLDKHFEKLHQTGGYGKPSMRPVPLGIHEVELGMFRARLEDVELHKLQAQQMRVPEDLVTTIGQIPKHLSAQDLGRPVF